ncbi:MAG: sulfur oxidation c-type cytochrome SoxX [Pseudomonadota bacterium]
MQWSARFLSTVIVCLLVWGGLSSANEMLAEDKASMIAEGKEIAFNRKKGNCLACHIMDDGEAAGNIGPPLIAMQQRFPDRAKLRAQIADATQLNSASRMPPFERHGILTPEEVDKIVEYLYTL